MTAAELKSIALCMCVVGEQVSSKAVEPSADMSELSVLTSQTHTVSSVYVSCQNNYIGDSNLKQKSF